MAKAGRKRRANVKREANGRIARAGAARDKGTQFAQDKASLYGTDGTDAIGRAYRSGKLGDDADNLLLTGRRIARAYWPMLGHGIERCSLGDRTGHANDDDLLDADEIKRKLDREEWLKETLRHIDRKGYMTRKAFDGLVININPDCGPAWLDRIIAGDPTSDDHSMLKLALSALREISS